MFGNRPPVVACDEMDDQKEAKHQNGFSQNPDDEDDSNFKSSFAVLETETLKQGHSDEDDEELKSENIYDQVVSPNLIEELDLGCVKSGGVLKLETNKFESNLPQNPSTNNVTSGHISHQNSGLTSPALSSSSSSSPDTVGSSAAISNNNFAEEWNGGWLERNIFGTEMSPVAVSTSAAGQQLKEDRIQESIAFAMKVDDELLQSEESSISTDEVKDLHGEESPTTTDRDDSSSDHTTTPESHEELVVQTVTVPTDGLGIATLTNHQDGGTPRNQRIFSGYYDDEKAQLLQTSSPPSPKDAQEGIREGDPCEDGAHHSEDEVIRLEGETRLASSMDNSIHPGRDNDDEARLIALSLNPESCLDMDTTTISTKDSTFCGQSRVQQRVLTENYNDEAFGQIFAKIARETSSVYPSRHRNNLLTDAAFCGISRVHRRELAQEHDEELDKILTSKAVVEPTTNTSFISKNIEQKTKIPAAEGTWRTRRVFAGCHEDEDDEKGMKIGTSDHSPPTTQYPPLSVETGHQNEGDSLVIAQFNSNKHTRGDSISPKDWWMHDGRWGFRSSPNKKLLDSAIHTIPVAILIINSEEVIVEVNDQCPKWFGTVVNVGDTVTGKFSSDKEESVNILSGSGHFQIGTYIYRYLSSVFQQDSNTYYSVCVIDDTDGYKKLVNAEKMNEAISRINNKSAAELVRVDPTEEEEIQSKKERFWKSAGICLDSDPNTTHITYSMEGVVLECSNDFRGYSKEELIGTASYECIHPDDIKLTAEKHVNSIDDNRKTVPVLSWFRKKHKNGQYVHTEFSGSMSYGDNGECWIGGIERVLSTDRMEKVVSSVLNQIPCGVVMVDSRTGYIEMCNHHAMNWLNIDKNQRFEDKLLRLKGPSLSETECDKLVSAVRACHGQELNECVDMDVSIKTNQGKVYTFIGRFQRTLNANQVESTTQTVLWIVNDVTALSNAMEKKQDAILQFMRRTSHDMRTPMQAISLAGYSIKEDCVNIGNLQSDVDTIISSSAVLESIVSNILEFKTINFMKLVPEFALINVKDKIERVVNILKHSTLKTDQVKLFCSFENWDDGHTILRLDEKLLDGIVLNLASNSLKFTSKGEVRVTCSVTRNEAYDPNSASEPGDESPPSPPLMLSIVVSDTGRGMDKTAQKHLGELGFFSGDEGGFGLGTYIVLSYVQLLNGTINIESEVGKGTTITVQIPTSTEVINLPNFGEAAGGAGGLLVSGEGRTKSLGESELEVIMSGVVLVVEDVTINRRLLVKALEKGGHIVKQAENGAIALEMMLKNNYRTVFMDINMPVMNGDEAIRRYWLETPPRDQHPKFLILTGNVTDSDRDMALACGAHEFLTKPIRPKKVLEAALWI